MRRVEVAVAEGVLVGNVRVGKGPRRAAAVPAMAVLVLSDFFCVCPCKLNALPLLKKSA